METNDSETQGVRADALRKLNEVCVRLVEVERGGKIVDIAQSLLSNVVTTLEATNGVEAADKKLLVGLLEALDEVADTTVPEQTDLDRLRSHLVTVTAWHDRGHALVGSEIETLRIASGLLAAVHQGFYGSDNEQVQRIVSGVQFTNRVNRTHWLATH